MLLEMMNSYVFKLEGNLNSHPGSAKSQRPGSHKLLEDGQCLQELIF